MLSSTASKHGNTLKAVAAKWRHRRTQSPSVCIGIRRPTSLYVQEYSLARLLCSPMKLRIPRSRSVAEVKTSE